MKVSRKDMADMMKIFLVSMLCTLPLVIIINIFVSASVSPGLMIFIDCVIFVGFAFVGYVIVDRHRKKIAKKRAEFEAQQKR